MKRYVRPSWSWRRTIRFRTCAWTETSSAETASSATMNSGSTARARAMPIRCRCPPLNWCGLRSAEPGARPDGLEQLLDPVATAGPRRELVHLQHLLERLAHGHRRVERRVRVLEDDLDPLAQLARLARAAPEDALAVVEDVAGRRRLELEHEPPERALPRAALADQPQRLAALDRGATRRRRRRSTSGVRRPPAPENALARRVVLRDVARLEERGCRLGQARSAHEPEHRGQVRVERRARARATRPRPRGARVTAGPLPASGLSPLATTPTVTPPSR